MKAVMLMFDSLNRDYLPQYGCEWTKLENFERLSKKCVTFDNFYAGSLPCMPARRELHTGRYNFMHRSWGPLEPFDESAIEKLKNNGVYTHLTSDHGHYFEDGGGTYHTRYNTWQFNRGQEGDPWIGQVKEPKTKDDVEGSKLGTLWRNDWVNRQFLESVEDFPQVKTINDGIDFINRNHEEDNWFLQVELFDPHEPFYTTKEYQDKYPHHYTGKHLDWPDYGLNKYSSEETNHLRMEYAALLTLCDESLGRVLDMFDEFNLWEDTMLIVNTDHGFMIGEKDWMGKNIQPCYNEVVRTPFMMWDPRFPNASGRRTALAQTIDIPATLLNFFGVEEIKYMEGVDLAALIKDDTAVRDVALFGVHGGHINITDGRHILMRAPREASNGPIFDYTLMPTHMNARFSVSELMNMELVNDYEFTQCPVLKIPASPYVNAYWYGDLLFDLSVDELQVNSIKDEDVTIMLLNKLVVAMKKNEVPKEQFQRVGLPYEEEVSKEWLETKGARIEFKLPKEFDELNFSKKGYSAMCILFSVVPKPMQGMLNGSVPMLKAIENEIDENVIYGLVKQAVPGNFSNMILMMIKGYLSFEN